jgi:hypothetical protein
VDRAIPSLAAAPDAGIEDSVTQNQQESLQGLAEFFRLGQYSPPMVRTPVLGFLAGLLR